MSKLWFIAHAGSGIDIHIARTMLAAGNAVIVTGGSSIPCNTKEMRR